MGSAEAQSDDEGCLRKLGYIASLRSHLVLLIEPRHLPLRPLLSALEVPPRQIQCNLLSIHSVAVLVDHLDRPLHPVVEWPGVVVVLLLQERMVVSRGGL